MKAIILATAYPHPASPKPIAFTKTCGVTLLERHVRTLKYCGIDRVDVVVKDDDVGSQDRCKELTHRGVSIRCRTLEQLRTHRVVADTESALIVLGDYVVEKGLIEAVLQAEGDCILVDSHPPADAGQSPQPGHGPVFAGVGIVSGAKIPSLAMHDQSLASRLETLGDVRQIDVNALPSFDPARRRDRRRVWMRIADVADVPVAETRLIKATQKGSLDWPAQVLHAPIENWAIARLCRTSITPNQLTLITNIVAWGVTALILTGHVVSALILAAVVGVMDGIDGKLARLKLMTSRIGKLEHAFDMCFEYSWWFALGWVLSQGDPSAPTFAAGIALILCNFADTVAAGVFWFYKGREHGRRLDNYTPFDLMVRKVSGRRNIYVWIILLTALLSSVELGLWVALAWGVVTILVRGGRTFMHLRDRRGPAEFEFVVR
jgi:phosphatidylglycerophosphate synthase